MPVATSVAFTWALGTEPPEGSVTVPLIAPRKVCAFIANPKDKMITTARNNRFMLSPPKRISESRDGVRTAPQWPLCRQLTSANHSPLPEKCTPGKAAPLGTGCTVCPALDNWKRKPARNQFGSVMRMLLPNRLTCQSGYCDGAD